MDSFADYEDFIDKWFECSEEEFDAVNQYDFSYILETSEGDNLAVEVPFVEAKKIEY